MLVRQPLFKAHLYSFIGQHGAVPELRAPQALSSFFRGGFTLFSLPPAMKVF